MRNIINNNLTMKNHHAYLKTITFPKDRFSLINKRIEKQYAQLETKDCCFGIFYSWSLLATILGIFTSYGNLESTEIFLDCLQYNYLPEISIARRKDYVKICICIMEKKLNERRAELENTAK
jgi:hypothetical protein